MIKLVYKDFKLLMSNKRDVLLTFLLPIALATLFALIFGRMGSGNEVNVGGVVQAIVGTAIMMALFSVAEIGASLLDEKEEGMLKKLLWAPFPKSHILYGKILFATIMVALQLFVVFIYGRIAFGLDIFKNIPAIILMIIAVSYASSGFGTFLATVGNTRKQVQAYATLIILVMSGVGGSMMPVNMMPDFMQKAAKFTVNHWGMQGFYDIFLRDRTLTNTHFLKALFILVFIGTILNTIAFLLFKRSLKKIT